MTGWDEADLAKHEAEARGYKRGYEQAHRELGVGLPDEQLKAELRKAATGRWQAETKLRETERLLEKERDRTRLLLAALNGEGIANPEAKLAEVWEEGRVAGFVEGEAFGSNGTCEDEPNPYKAA